MVVFLKNRKLIHSFKNSKFDISQWHSSSTQYMELSQVKVCLLYSFFTFIFYLFGTFSSQSMFVIFFFYIYFLSFFLPNYALNVIPVHKWLQLL